MPKRPTGRWQRVRALTVTSNLPGRIAGILPWERELLLPVVGTLVDSTLTEHMGEHPRSPRRKKDEVEIRFRAECRRLGVIVEGRKLDENGDVVLRCRLPKDQA